MAVAPKKPTCKQLMSQLQKLGKESHRKTFIRHGGPPGKCYGVPIADLKPIQRRIKKDYQLAMELFATGIADAQYLAGLIADETRMKKSDFNRWARESVWCMIGTCSVAWAAGESPHAIALGTKWIDSKKEEIACTGWATLSSYLSVTPDEEIDLALFESLLARVVVEIHGERNEVKDCMNSFVMASGCSVKPLKAKALKAARKIGKVDVDVGDTSCKIHLAEDFIKKVEKMGRIGKKRKSARC
jgi:3-methyladenine DNA glycosylase AlkD